MPLRLSPAHRNMLDCIYRSWVADGQWPVFAEIDKALDRAGNDALELLRELFPSYIMCEPGGMPPTNDTELRLTSTGLGALTTKPAIVDTFLAAIRFLANVEQQHTPTPQEPSAVVTSDDLASYLETSTGVPRPRSVADQMASSLTPFLQGDGWLWTNFSNNADGWTLTISREIRRFRDVSSLEEYHQRRRESLAPETSPAISDTTRHRSPKTAIPEAVMTLKTPDPCSVFIVHGRDLAARDALADFLRALGLRPIDFEQMVAATGSAAPYIGEAVTAGFKEAQAVIVLLTPDDEARLLQQLRGPDEPLHERELTGQARPNVLFEAGMALAMHPTRTVFVEIGKLRPFTDVAGRHTVRLNGISSLHTLAKRLETAGCQVNYSGPDWLRVERFTTLLAHTRAPVASSADPTPDTPQPLPRGQILAIPPKSEPEPNLEASIHRQGDNYLLEIVNRGGLRLTSVAVEMPVAAGNWHLVTQVLPHWPIATLEPREYRRLPVSVSMGGPVVVEAEMVALTPGGEPYRKSVTLSVYG